MRCCYFSHTYQSPNVTPMLARTLIFGLSLLICINILRMRAMKVAAVVLDNAKSTKISAGLFEDLVRLGWVCDKSQKGMHGTRLRDA